MSKDDIEIVPFLGEDPYSNAYAVIDPPTGASVLIDAGNSFANITDYFDSHPHLELKFILLTCGHFFHTARCAEISLRYDAKVALHEKALPELMRIPSVSQKEGLCGVKLPKVSHFLLDSEILKIGNLNVEVIQTPGKFAGSVSLIIAGQVFSGPLGKVLDPRLAADVETQKKWKDGKQKLCQKAHASDWVYPGKGSSFPLLELKGSEK